MGVEKYGNFCVFELHTFPTLTNKCTKIMHSKKNKQCLKKNLLYSITNNNCSFILPLEIS